MNTIRRKTLQDGTTIPEDFTELKIDDLKIYSDGKKVVICGQPPDNDNEAEAHNCDDMGCGWEHVLLTFENKNKKNNNGIYLDWMMKNE